MQFSFNFRKRKKKPIWIYLDVGGDDEKMQSNTYVADEVADDDDASFKMPTRLKTPSTSIAMSQTFVVKSPSNVEINSNCSDSTGETML